MRPARVERNATAEDCLTRGIGRAEAKFTAHLPVRSGLPLMHMSANILQPAVSVLRPWRRTPKILLAEILREDVIGGEPHIPY